MKKASDNPGQLWFDIMPPLPEPVRSVTRGSRVPAPAPEPVTTPAPAPKKERGVKADAKKVFLIAEHGIKEAPLTEASPGKFVPTLQADQVRKFAFMELKVNADGTITPAFRRFPSRARIVVVAEATGISVNSLVRLAKNIDPVTEKTFIQFATGTPNSRMVDLHSVVAHLRATEDPDFWTPARRKAFNKNVY